MLYHGDYVRHSTFPPVEGYVSAIEKLPSGNDKIGVMQANQTIFWDLEDTWELVQEVNIIGNPKLDENVIDVECIEVREIEEDI